jgi:hypothetical protein
MSLIAIASLQSLSPYSQSRAHQAPRREKETGEDYERRTWSEKAHVDSAGEVFIPGMALKMALDSAARRLAIQVPGKGKATYTKHFLAGCLVQNDIPLGLRLEDLSSDRIYANADGVRGSGKRVWRQFPKVDEWQASVSFAVVDDAITEDVFKRVLTEAGQFVGIGRFRPENGGLYGRFSFKDLRWGSP